MKSMEKLFSGDPWKCPESLSGFGSTLSATKAIRDALPVVFSTFGIRSVLDIPCGDFHWMQHVDLDGIKYIGADVVSSLIEQNRNYGRDFRLLDITEDPLPRVDLILCRDCFGHLSLQHCLEALSNIRRSGSTYFLVTSYFRHPGNTDKITNYTWKTRNMTTKPFSFPPPLVSIDELCEECYPSLSDKSLGLWKMSDL